MAAADQKRDDQGRFADEGKGAITDAQVCARNQKRLIKYQLQLKALQVRYENQRHAIEDGIMDVQDAIREDC